MLNQTQWFKVVLWIGPGFQFGIIDQISATNCNHTELYYVYLSVLCIVN